MDSDYSQKPLRIFCYETRLEEAYIEAIDIQHADEIYKDKTGRDPVREYTSVITLESHTFTYEDQPSPRFEILDKPLKYAKVVAKKIRKPKIWAGIGPHIPPTIDELPRIAVILPPWINSLRRLYSWFPRECFFCETPFDTNILVTKDHLWPKALGGRVIVPACYGCNADKGCRLPSEVEIEKFLALCRIGFCHMRPDQREHYLSHLEEGDRELYGF
jgi:hypothetical protein